MKDTRQTKDKGFYNMAVISTKLAGLRISFDEPTADTATALTSGYTLMDFDLAESVPNIFPTDYNYNAKNSEKSIATRW